MYYNMTNKELLDAYNASTKDLLYAIYRYKHCDGDCASCPCFNEGYDCTDVNNEIIAELDRRGE